MLSIGTAGSYINSPTFLNAEVLITTLPAVSMPKDSVVVLLLFGGQLRIGTGTTAVTFRIRQGSGITGVAIVTLLMDNLPAQVNVDFTVMGLDLSIFGAQPTWCLTGQGTGSTSNNQIMSGVSAAIFLW